MITWAIVVGAGSGSRYGGPKQYELLGGRRVLDWSLEWARTVCDGVVLVVPDDRVDHPEPAVDIVVPGGATRSASVRAGLATLAGDVEQVLVHDAARPLASGALWRAVRDELQGGSDAVVPVVPITDTVRSTDGGAVDRATLVAVQTPQGFRVDVLRRAHEDAPEATDDASLVEAIGGQVVHVEGEPPNRKITTPDDLAMMAGRLLLP